MLYRYCPIENTMLSFSGAFLVPYFLMLVIAGIPMYFLELALGQYASLGPVGIWNLAPVFRGLHSHLIHCFII